MPNTAHGLPVSLSCSSLPGNRLGPFIMRGREGTPMVVYAGETRPVEPGSGVTWSLFVIALGLPQPEGSLGAIVA